MNTKDEKYWIWLQHVISPGSPKVKTIVDRFHSARAFYEQGFAQVKKTGILSKRELEIVKEFTIEKAEDVLKRSEDQGQKVIPYNDVRFPERLRNIPNPPCALYVQGEMPDIDQILCISIVGTRSASKEGLQSTFELAYGLACRGVLVVSGGALGIDAMAHKGAIKCAGTTIAVLGCGIDYPYLMSNLGLRQKITESGALISEYPPGYPVLGRNFPIRNRLISGLSLGTLVVEAGVKSGALITANHALEQNRDVYAVPGNIHSPGAKGTNLLIKNGAKPVMCVEDILEDYLPLCEVGTIKEESCKGDKFPTEEIKIENKGGGIQENLTENAMEVYRALRPEPLHIDEITRRTKLPTHIVLQSITELELYGYICSFSGRRYSLKGNE